MRSLTLVAVVAGCGRIGFDPSDGDTTRDARRDDGSTGGNAETCATARLLAIGVPIALDVAGATDDHPGPLCGNGPERVFAFEQSAPVFRSIRLDAAFSGSYSLDSTCPPSPTGSCQTFNVTSPVDSMSSVAAGTSYIVIDKLAGTGTTFTIRID